MQRLFLPKEIKEWLDENFSLANTGPSSGQGYDYHLEQKNRNVKGHVKNDSIPSNDDWTKICSNFESLEKNFDTIYDTLDLDKRDNETTRYLPLEDLIEKWRARLRETKFISENPTDHANGKFQSISGVDLHEGLLQFVDKAALRREHLIHTTILCKEPIDHSSITHPVYKTPQEELDFNLISRQSADRIQKEIESMLGKISDPITHNLFENLYKRQVKNKAKQKVVDMHDILKEYLDDTTKQ